MEHRLFSEFETNELDEASILTLIWLDTVITDAVDALRYTIKDTDMLLLSREGENINQDFRLITNGNNPKKNIPSKAGRIPQEYAERSSNLLPLPFVQLLHFSRQTFATELQKADDFSDSKLSLRRRETELKSIPISIRKHTITFEYPVNGHIYFALTCQTFQSLTFSLIRALQAAIS